MNLIVQVHTAIFSRLEVMSGSVLPSLARLVFAGVLLAYYWNSALTKVGDGILGVFRPSDAAYIQILPKAVEAAGYDFSQLGTVHWLVVLAGTWAEFLLPLLIVVGFLTRLAALAMIGFVAVQSWVDVTGHGLGASDVGAWFDRLPSALVLDQRAFWAFLLLVLVFRGAGPLSVDRVLVRNAP